MELGAKLRGAGGTGSGHGGNAGAWGAVLVSLGVKGSGLKAGV